jgi:hypothetical protein
LRQRQDWLIETAEHARANARREFGKVGLVIEVTRDMWGWASPERLIQDLRFGVRMWLVPRAELYRNGIRKGKVLIMAAPI